MTKHRRRPHQIETPIMRKIIDYLHLKGWLAWEIFNQGIFRRSTRSFVKNDQRYRPSGIPDVIAHKDGKTIWVEVKAPGGYPSAEQKAIHERLRAQSIPVAVCRSIEDVDAFLKEVG